MPPPSDYANGVPCWVDLSTADIAAARRFYGELFGWDWEGFEVEAGTYWVASISGARVAGVSAPPPALDERSSWNIWIRAIDVDAAVARAEANGAEIAAAPFDVPGLGRGATVVDPAGAGFGVWEPAGHPGADVTDEHGAVVWHELLTPNIGGAAAFYGAVFGWVRGTMEFPHGSTYTTFFLDVETIGGIAPPPAAGTPPQWRVWFGSDDVSASVGKAVELGGSVTFGPADSPIGRYAHLRDPSGAAFNVIAAA